MAWQDGSRFNIANGVKWGTGPKFFYGPSTDNPWNHDLNWRDYCTHVNHNDSKARERRLVLTPAPETSIGGLINPGQMVYRPATSDSVSSATRGDTALSAAGRKLLAKKLREEARKEGRSSRSSRLGATGARVATLTPTTKAEISDLKATLRRQAEAQAKTDSRMEELTAAILELKDLTVRANGAGGKTRKKKQYRK